MKKLFAFFCLFCSLSALSGEADEPVFHLTREIVSQTNSLPSSWKFMAGDLKAWAEREFEDGHWQMAPTKLDLSEDIHTSFRGIGWFRLRFLADSSLIRRPLALGLTHHGASEIYLDGKLITSFGTIEGKENSIYEDPQNLPIVFFIPDTGSHVIAVRYANYDAEKNHQRYRSSKAGFKMTLGYANATIESENTNKMVLIATIMLLTGIFISLSLIHLFLFLYFRTVRMNLYFSLFMFSIASLFVIGFINTNSIDPGMEIISKYLLFPAIATSCISLSGFINGLSPGKKIAFKFIAFLGIGTILLYFFGMEMNILTTLIATLVIGALVYTVFTVIYAMVRRIRGARIIGTGVLFFALFWLSVFLPLIIRGGNFEFKQGSGTGTILIVMLGLAIISIPFSMSVYLAWNFSEINKDLEVQLHQVKLLSEKSLEQEQDKQRLL